MSEPVGVRCSSDGCPATIPPGKSGYVSRWATMKAQREGWFFTRDGEAYCSEHIPSWVTGWRASRR